MTRLPTALPTIAPARCGLLAVVLFLTLLGLTIPGCSSSRSPSGSIPDQATAAMKNLRVGMLEAEAIALMRPVSLDWGRTTYGATGAGKLYFQISHNRQIWLEIGLRPWRVTSISRPEPKRKWKHLLGDEISVPW